MCPTAERLAFKIWQLIIAGLPRAVREVELDKLLARRVEISTSTFGLDGKAGEDAPIFKHVLVVGVLQIY